MSRLMCMKPAVMLIVVLAVVGAVSPQVAQAAAAGDGARDVLVLHDGRELEGRVLEETSSGVRFEIIRGSIRSTMTFSHDQVREILRDELVEKAGDPRADRDTPPAQDPGGGDDPSGDEQYEHSSDDPNVPGIYVIPMEGQMGTDIHPSVYLELKDDILEQDPDLIVIKMNCSDRDDLLIPLNEATEEGLFMHSEYRELVNFFKDDLRHIPQVMWIQDSYGFSSLVAMAWEDIYMSPRARLAGLSQMSQLAEGWSDPDVRAKMLAAWLGIGRSFLEYGNHPYELAEALMRPEKILAASFEGREVNWDLDGEGDILVNNSTERALVFDAKLAEDLLVSKGTVEDLDDLLFLEGFREYRILETDVPRVVERYWERWRSRFEQTEELIRDYQQYLDWAQGDDEIRYLGRARSALNQIIGAMEQYEAIEIRWRTDYGMTQLHLEVMAEQLAEQIRAARRGGRRR